VWLGARKDSLQYENKNNSSLENSYAKFIMMFGHYFAVDPRFELILYPSGQEYR